MSTTAKLQILNWMYVCRVLRVQSCRVIPHPVSLPQTSFSGRGKGRRLRVGQSKPQTGRQTGWLTLPGPIWNSCEQGFSAAPSLAARMGLTSCACLLGPRYISRDITGWQHMGHPPLPSSLLLGEVASSGTTWAPIRSTIPDPKQGS